MTSENEYSVRAPWRTWDSLHEAWHFFRFPIIAGFLLWFCVVRAKRSRQGRAQDDEKVSTQPIAASRPKVLPEKARAPDPAAHTVQGSRSAPSLKKSPEAAKRFQGSRKGAEAPSSTSSAFKIRPLIFYFSLTDSTKHFISTHLQPSLEEACKRDEKLLPPSVLDLSDVDLEDYFESLPKVDQETSLNYFYILVIPTYNIDTSLDSFLTLLQETHNDFRIDNEPLSRAAGYSVFGFGDREGWPTEPEGFCSQAIEVDKWMAKLTGRKRAFPLGLGDVKSDASSRFVEWCSGLTSSISDITNHGSLGEGVEGSGEANESDEEDASIIAQGRTRKRIGPKKRNTVRLDDLEDLGMSAKSMSNLDEADENDVENAGVPLAIDFTTTSKPRREYTPKPMVPVTSPTYAALTKQGYTIVGSHSGVKICRWTKSALRGRGSCYKFSFYGIKSHLCMETTPSLSCSNKCVFCWRHGTNPVGTTWRWEVDPPDLIFAGAKQGHYQKIKMMKGVPGVRAERFQEAMKIRHCALSLVGEPIFYPHINEFVDLLHQEHISSFLVCNAQHPDQLARLKPVTQLYVSIDASNPESLRKIDRPLHRDYWQRFTRCLDILREKRDRMRTVFRLTLVKGFNIEEEVEGYADLVERARPCFVEIKGVTYCGSSSNATPSSTLAGDKKSSPTPASSSSSGPQQLTMRNVPFYAEVVEFVNTLNLALSRRPGCNYGIAAEHAHSCCALIGDRDRFFIEGEWHTIIDYEKFFECVESGREDWGPEDYIGPPTPEWARWGNGGFDPADERVFRKKGGAKKDVEVKGDRLNGGEDAKVVEVME